MIWGERAGEKIDQTAGRYAAKVYLRQRPGRPAFSMPQKREKWCARNEKLVRTKLFFHGIR